MLRGDGRDERDFPFAGPGSRRRDSPPFRPAPAEKAAMQVLVSRRAARELVMHASSGYGELYKREVGGHLLGYLLRGGLYVGRAVPYNTPFRSRSGWSPDAASFERKGRALETRRLHWIGVYHSHVEVAGSASTVQSAVDRQYHRMSACPLEVIVRVANFRIKGSRRCLSLSSRGEDGASLHFDICADVKDPRGKITRVPVILRARRSGTDQGRASTLRMRTAVTP